MSKTKSYRREVESASEIEKIGIGQKFDEAAEKGSQKK